MFRFARVGMAHRTRNSIHRRLYVIRMSRINPLAKDFVNQRNGNLDRRSVPHTDLQLGSQGRVRVPRVATLDRRVRFRDTYCKPSANGVFVLDASLSTGAA